MINRGIVIFSILVMCFDQFLRVFQEIFVFGEEQCIYGHGIGRIESGISKNDDQIRELFLYLAQQ
jgi:hypothetical protein